MTLCHSVKTPLPKVLEVVQTMSTSFTECDEPIEKLNLSKCNLSDDDLSSTVRLPPNLLQLDLSRNCFTLLPSPVFQLTCLVTLDLSRNSLHGLPTEIRLLKNLKELIALSNNIRLRQLPLKELASLSQLHLLDLRYNSKLKQDALDKLQLALLQPYLNVRCTLPKSNKLSFSKKLSACDRDATLLRSQLEPLSTPQLRKRLERTFHVTMNHEDPDAFDREFIMTRLLECYHKRGGRQIRLERGIPVKQEWLDSLLHELEAIHWPHTTRERPKINAQYYMILQKPGSGQVDSVKTQRETAKLQKYNRLFELAVETIHQVDPAFSKRFTALAVTKNFTGSPHIDTLNISPFYGIALGDYELGGGKLAVECCPMTVAEIDTRGRFGKVDGRFPHWVTPYQTGTRYSLIYYVTSGEVEPQTTAIFDPNIASTTNVEDESCEEPWIPPPFYVP